MILTVASLKGGVGKTVTSLHLAAYLNTLAPTIYFDADPRKFGSGWARRGSLPFPVEPVEAAVMLAHGYVHKVTDTGQGPTSEQLISAARGSDLLVIPVRPNGQETEGVAQTLEILHKAGRTNYRVLFTRVTPDMAPSVMKVRELLASVGGSAFKTEIPRMKAFEKADEAGSIVGPEVDRKVGARAWAAYAAVGAELGLGAL